MVPITSNSSVSPLGVMFTYINPFLMGKLFLTWNSALPSSEVEYSPMHSLSRASLLWGVMPLFIFNHLWQAANNAFSHCASSQLVICIDANFRAQACASLFRQSHSALKGWLMRTFPLPVTPVTASSSRDHTVSRSCVLVLGSAHQLRCCPIPFGIPNWIRRTQVLLPNSVL